MSIAHLSDALTLLDRLPASVARIDGDLRVVYANARLCRALGRTPEGVVGRTCTELGMDVAVWEHWTRTLMSVFETGRPAEFEFTSRHDGRERLVLAQFTPEFLPGADRAATVLALAQTRDELQTARATLADEQALFDRYFEVAPVLMWLLDDAGRYVRVNRNYAEALGATPEELIGQVQAERYPADARNRMRRADAQARAGPCRRVETVTVNGRSRTRLAVRFAFGDHRGAGYLGGVAVDVTDQRRLEQDRRELEHRLIETQSLEALGTLAGRVAQEFNNQLTVILGQASLVRLQLGAYQATGGLERIEQAAQRTGQLCQQLLSLSGHSLSLMKPHDLAELVRQFEPVLTKLTADRAELVLDLPTGLPRVRCDAVEVRRAVVQLVMNAAHAVAPAGGVVTVRCGPGDDGSSYVRLEVADNGCGMTPEVEARAFEPLFTTRPPAHGLGLPAVRGIVRSHRGRIRLSTRPGEGTRVELLLPCDQSRDLAPARFGRGRAVVTDAADLVTVLADAGFRVVPWSDDLDLAAPPALSVFHARTPAEGLAALEQFQADWPLVGAVLLTPRPADPDGLAPAATPVVAWPGDPETLLRAVYDAVGP